LEQISQQQYDLIILDDNLSDPDAFICCQELRTYLPSSVSLIIMLLNYQQPANIDKALQTGADDCLSKPLHIQLMLKQVKLILEDRLNLKKLKQQKQENYLQTIEHIKSLTLLNQRQVWLEEKVNERNRALRESNLQLQNLQTELAAALSKEYELNQLKSRIITTISHEYRTPLMTISLSAGLLKRYRNKWDEAKQNQHFQRIESAIQYLTHILEEVLFINNTEIASEAVIFSNQDILALSRKILEDVNSMVTEKHNLKLISHHEKILADINENLFRQLLRNLLSNGIKYSPDGGLIILALETNEKNVIIKVSDRGIGIPAEHLPKLYDTFSRADNVGNIGGTGLGMLIIKKCVDSHHGTIDVVSRVNVGTTFTVTLPIKQVNPPKSLLIN
ncbi:MAG: hybrid sensor histidine kinase/response regulator, partial [Microcoleaceae cyanobacterium]